MRVLPKRKNLNTIKNIMIRDSLYIIVILPFLTGNCLSQTRCDVDSISVSYYSTLVGDSSIEDDYRACKEKIKESIFGDRVFGNCKFIQMGLVSPPQRIEPL